MSSITCLRKKSEEGNKRPILTGVTPTQTRRRKQRRKIKSQWRSRLYNFWAQEFQQRTERKDDDLIQEDSAVRVTDIVTLDLKDEEIKTFTETYCPPNNCKLIDPPKVNVEMICKDDAGTDRDKVIIKNQLKGSASVAATTKTLTILLDQDAVFEKNSRRA